MDRNELLEQTVYVPAAPTPENYNLPFQSREHVKNPELSELMPRQGYFWKQSTTRNLPFKKPTISLYYFSLFFINAILEHIVEATNSYKSKRYYDAMDCNLEIN